MRTFRLTKDQLNETVTVVCYGDTEKKNRRDLLDFYEEAADCCDGSEADRYYFICQELRRGCSYINADTKTSR